MKRKTEKGQSLVELAVSFIVLVFLIAGATELSIALFQSIQLRDSAQEGALYGSLCQNPVEVEKRVRWASDRPIDMETNLDVQVVQDVFVDSAGLAIKVTVSYPHKVFMPFVPEIIGSDYIYLKGEVVDTVLVETTDCP